MSNELHGNCIAGYLEKEDNFHVFARTFHKVSTGNVRNRRCFKFQMVTWSVVVR